MVWELHLPACQSLKDKRTIVKRVSTDRRHAESVLREADQLVAGADGARIVDTSTSYL